MPHQGKPFVLTRKGKEALERIARAYHLRFVILHGSYAKGTPQKGSDLDIAVLGGNSIPFDKLLELHGELGKIFGDNPERELDVKSLHRADLLLRYYVTRDGILLYGDATDYNEFKTYARRAFEDSSRLFHLEAVLLKKQNKLILESLIHA